MMVAIRFVLVVDPLRGDARFAGVLSRLDLPVLAR
jgi:hypothetical protein